MTTDFALHLISQLLMAAVIIASPLLGLTLAVGVLVSMLQVVTQVQEASLSFVPKALTAVVVLVAFGPWMLKRLLQFSSGVILHIPAVV